MAANWIWWVIFFALLLLLFLAITGVNNEPEPVAFPMLDTNEAGGRLRWSLLDRQGTHLFIDHRTQTIVVFPRVNFDSCGTIADRDYATFFVGTAQEWTIANSPKSLMVAFEDALYRVPLTEDEAGRLYSLCEGTDSFMDVLCRELHSRMSACVAEQACGS